ncbi:MAG: polyketide synthase, partial [Maribacter sp.]|nr:polyketide synthase [Maribacter sp.]
QQAKIDGDPILGIIKASGINQDGKTNGITAPSSVSQEQLLIQTYKKSGIDPAKISYVEAHGTGTPLGDPIEVNALNDAFQKFTPEKNYCALGSVKSNLGHSVFAAGICGVIKVLLCMKYGKLVPSINYKKHNPHIHFEESPFYVNTRYKDWESKENEPRLAAVSSFGFSGT